MEQTDKKTKQRLYKVAAELNLSHDALIEFLKKKGHDIKGHMSPVDENMMDEILRHFKKEKVDADRHARKRKEYDEKERKRRGEDKKEPEKEEKKETVKIDIKEVIHPVIIKPVEAPPVKEPIAIEIPEEKAIIEIAQEIELIPQADKQTIIDEEETQKIEIEKVSKVKTAVEKPKKKAKIVEEELPLFPQEIIPETIVQKLAEEIVVIPEVETKPIIEAVVPGEPFIIAQPSAEATSQKESKTVTTEEPVRRRKKKPPKELDVSLEASIPKMGLKVMGKMDLETVQKPAPKEETQEGSKPVDGTSDAEVGGIHKKKKKKKKILREQTTQVIPDVVESEELKLKKKAPKPKQREVDMDEVDDAIKRTLASMDETTPVLGRAVTRKKKREKRAVEEMRQQEISAREKNIIRVSEFMTVNGLATLMRVTAAEVISKLMNMGVMASINQRLDFDTITLVAADFGFDVEKVEAITEDALEDVEDDIDSLITRPPIVTIMGHVDHGKTSLLDYIRNANVVAGEAGGITQHIGAYTVTLENTRQITFLDTPGHEAFTAMRARGAQVTDIVVLVVAADDSVMPQTLEAISHALAANVPIIIAINKIDKAESNPERIRQQLSERNILVEQWGGKYGCIEVSAKKGLNIEELLNRILLEADILDLKANPNRQARGVVIEAELDRGKGIIATVLIQKGTLKVGDPFVVGVESGKVRLMLDERGKKVNNALPSTPVQVIGFDGMPQAGDVFVVLDSDRDAREIGNERQQLKREMAFRQIQRKTLDDISAQIKMGGIKELSILVKGDVDGSVEALSDSLMKLSTEEVHVHVIHKGIGAISESDVLLASASNAIIIGFHVRPHLNARRLAATEHVDIRLYEIIYNAIQDVRNALEGMLTPDINEEITSTITVREIFKISRLGTIAGCYVLEGKVNRNHKIRLIRDGIVMFTGSVVTLKRFKDDVREVEQGYECGISLDGYNDVKVGDTLETFKMVETKRVLA